LKVLKEARTLSLLDHSNIVRYYGCWLHNKPSIANRIPPALTMQERKPPRKISSFIFPPPEAEGTPRVAAKKGNDRPELLSSTRDPTEIEYALDSLESGKEAGHSKYNETPSRSLESDVDSPSGGLQAGEEFTDVLYIQTEICDFNLEEYLEQRSLLVKKSMKQLEERRQYLKHDMEVYPNLFYEGFSITLQMLAALRYVHHTHKLIHRDLKPSNIFMIKKSKRGLRGRFAPAAEAG
jgi:serine/threonine protein kinase